jgi:hypothetical protein
MAAPRRVIDISMEEDDLTRLERIARSRTEPAGWVERARILLAYRSDPWAQPVSLPHQTVLRCLGRSLRFGVMALRHIRVVSKAELKARILAYLNNINAEPVVHTWSYKIGEAACQESLHETLY